MLPNGSTPRVVVGPPQVDVLVESPGYSAYFAEKTDGSPLDGNPALVVLCFSLIDRGSLLSIRDKVRTHMQAPSQQLREHEEGGANAGSVMAQWLPYISQYEIPRQCVALVGMKADLRDEMLAHLPKPSKLKKDASAASVGDGTSAASSAAGVAAPHALLLEPSTHAVFRIGNLPTEVLLQIFSHLPTKDLAASSAVCKRWHRVANSPMLWKSRTRGAPVRSEEAKKVLRDAELQLYFEVAATDEKSLRSFYSKLLQRGKKSAKYYNSNNNNSSSTDGGKRGPVTPAEPTTAL